MLFTHYPPEARSRSAGRGVNKTEAYPAQQRETVQRRDQGQTDPGDCPSYSINPSTISRLTA